VTCGAAENFGVTVSGPAYMGITGGRSATSTMGTCVKYP
jgi:hypothetical protein